MMDQITELILKVQGKKDDEDFGKWEQLLDSIRDDLEIIGHVDARTVDEAGNLLRAYKDKRAKVIGGGTDILRLLRQKYIPELPDVLVNIKTIPGLAYIKEEEGFLKMGALTLLSELAESGLIKTKYSVLAEAAGVVGSPQIRNMATIAGAVCQDVNCWYYRAGKDFFHCSRKRGSGCPARVGDNRWMFSIFESPEESECCAVCQSDIAVALVALEASILTGERSIPLNEFYTASYPGTVLKEDEVIKEIQVPVPLSGTRMKYSKFSIRRSLDHPLVSVACTTNNRTTRIAIGGVYISPYTDRRVEEILHGKRITGELAKRAGSELVKCAKPLSMNSWKVNVSETLVKRTLLELDRK